jgi:hypothetical protein
MTGAPDDVPGYQTIRISGPENPVAEMAEVDAWQAFGEYPVIAHGGGPEFGVAREREEGGWVLHPFFGADWPQHARDSLGSHVRRLAAEADRSGDRAAQEECMLAARRMDRQLIDELTVLGVRYRVVRAQPFIRKGPSGPEPPRPTDPDPAAPEGSQEPRNPTDGFVIDPVLATGLPDGLLKLELLDSLRLAGSVPPDVRADDARAAATHPGGVLLPPAFTVGELADGQWGAVSPGTSPTPRRARKRLASYLRIFGPWQLNLDEEQRGIYAAAADRLEETGSNDLTVAGRAFRVVRVERLVRIGPDGPEGPRPSDPDPQGPVLEGLALDEDPVYEEDEEPDDPVEETEDYKRLERLIREEERRRDRP